jgi:hypothetical protein
MLFLKKKKKLIQLSFIAENNLKGIPPGHPYPMRRYAKQYHQIDCLDKHPDDYQNIFFEFLTFLKVNVMIIIYIDNFQLLILYYFRME